MKPIELLPVLSILLGVAITSPNPAAAQSETGQLRPDQPVAESNIHSSEVVKDELEDDEYDFAILRKIDTSPSFALRATRNGAATRGASKARSLVNFMLDTRGTDWSKEGADVAIDKKSDVSSETTKFYEDQIHRDDLHWQVVSLIARIASALGDDSTPGSRDRAVADVNRLQQLIGVAETDIVMKWFVGREAESARSEIPKTVRFDLPRILDAQDLMKAAALEQDSVIAALKKELLPYALKGKGKRVATKVAYSALGAAAFVPNWIAPIAELSFLSTMMANGGPEQDKLLKELYYSKRLERRYDLVEKELNLALNSREISVASGNAPLYRFSRELTEYLCGEDMERRLFPDDNAPGANELSMKSAVLQERSGD